MKVLYLVSLLINGFIWSSSYEYNLKMVYKRGATSQDNRSQVVLNGNTMNCFCGKTPSLVMFVYGDPQCYCVEHVPEIEHIRPIDMHNVNDILRSIGNPNGHNGIANGN